jgi:xanthine dehydrogenase accessory factor
MSEVSAVAAAQAALAATTGAAPVAIAMTISGDGSVRRMIVQRDTVVGALPPHVHERALEVAHAALLSAPLAPIVETIGDSTLYVEVHQSREQLVIVGAGHIAVPLAHLGTLLDFAVTVLDDREEFATSERFDAAVNVLQSDFAVDPFAGASIGADTYIALVTRGHRWDFDCLQRLITMPAQPRYIGMIGSRRRVRAAFRALLDAGVPRAMLARVHAPIGLDLEAETPVEIAVSIAAELIAVRRGARTASLATREQVLERFLREEA